MHLDEGKKVEAKFARALLEALSVRSGQTMGLVTGVFATQPGGVTDGA